MRKLLLLTLSILCYAFGYAQTKTYTDDMVVKLGTDKAYPAQKTTIYLTEKANKITLELKNFIFGKGTEGLGVGHITLKDIPTQTIDSKKTFKSSGTAALTAGDTPGIGFWLASVMPEIPMSVEGHYTADSLQVDITLKVSLVPEPIIVEFGHHDRVTGIKHISLPALRSGTYTIDGRKTGTANRSHGIFISDGKKVIR